MHHEAAAAIDDLLQGLRGVGHAVNAGRVRLGTDQHQVVLQPRLRIDGVAIGHQIDDRVAGVHGDQVGLAGPERYRDRTFGP